MKKISILSLGLMFLLSGCLKDKGFENQQYGIKDPGVATASPGIGFNLTSAGSFLKPVGLNLQDQTQNINPSNLTIGYFAPTPAATDLRVRVAIDDSIRVQYNRANGTNILLLDPSLYVMPTELVIPAGAQNAGITIQVPSTNTLSANEKYGIPVRIVSSDNGTAIAKNLDKVLIQVIIKNKYDGVYGLKFSNYHPSLNPAYDGDSTVVELRTTGANTVKIYWEPLSGYYNPAVLNGGLTAFGSQEPEYAIDPVTNKVVVSNSFPGATTLYAMNSSYDSYYDLTAKKMYCKWGYRYTSGVFDPASTREWTQEFTYLGPR